jgi:selenide,water dikinase
MDNVKLTQFSHGAGCGCKIAPALLDTILKTNTISAGHSKLLVGNGSKDDAAVFDIGNGMALISTTDFFTPIVDDAFAFGRIAGANAISDVYAMGGKPILAIAILGWPVDKLPPNWPSRFWKVHARFAPKPAFRWQAATALIRRNPFSGSQ